MASISELPNELILNVLSCFEHNKWTLRHLALVSSGFRPLAKQFLLKHLLLSADVEYSESGRPYSYGQIMGMLVEDPNTATHVRTLDISWTDSDPENDPRAKNLLTRLPLLEYLEIQTTFSKDTQSPMRPFPSFQFLEDHPFDRLTKLKVDNDIGWIGLTEFLFHPKLNDLFLFCLPQYDTSYLREEFHHRSSPVRRI